MARALVIEDNEEMVELFIKALSPDIDIDSASDVDEVNRLLGSRKYDMFIVDLRLPNTSGHELCSVIKNDPAHSKVPVVFVSSDCSEYAQLISFKLGADDYITKPIKPVLFRAKILSKIYNKLSLSSSNSVIKAGVLSLKPNSFKASISNTSGTKESLDLTPNEFKILMVFVQNRDKIIKRGHLIDSVWGHGVYINDRVVDQHISSLRKKLRHAKDYIRTVYGVGYMFSVGDESKAVPTDTSFKQLGRVGDVH